MQTHADRTKSGKPWNNSTKTLTYKNTYTWRQKTDFYNTLSRLKTDKTDLETPFFLEDLKNRPHETEIHQTNRTERTRDYYTNTFCKI